MRSLQGLVAMCLVLTALGTTSVHAIAPDYISEKELAKHSIIVLAQWEKAAFRPHHRYEKREDLERVITDIECFTKLKILKVLKGEAKLGEAELMVKWGIAWDKDGLNLSTGTSTELPGDVEDVTKPCLWFLEPTASWDETRKEKYLTVDNFRQVQPAELADFYLALGKPDAAERVPKLLDAGRPVVAERVLKFLMGDRLAWPDGDSPFTKPEARGDLVRSEAARVWDYVTSDAKGARNLAVSVYAELSGKEGIANLRTLLEDRDPEVRATVVGLLAHQKDLATADRFAKALEGLQDGGLSVRVIEALATLQDERAAPALIGFLQNDDWGTPAIDAREALLKITGHEFPLDVEQSRKAWGEASRQERPEDRKRILEELAPGAKSAIVAKAIGLPTRRKAKEILKGFGDSDDGNYQIKVELHNQSPRELRILSKPSGVEIAWPSGHSFSSTLPGDEKAKHQFRKLAADERFTIDLVVDEDFLIAAPDEQRLTLEYLINGHRQGENGWMGTVDVEFGADWKYERKTVMVEETWPNGNLKAVGSKVNGVKQGEWNYFNEEGDRIRIEYFGTGQGTAECNTEHPENKGAGKRKPK